MSVNPEALKPKAEGSRNAHSRLPLPSPLFFLKHPSPMSSSRSRLRTVGAFGNPKPRPIGFVPKSSGTTSQPASNSAESPAMQLNERFKGFYWRMGILNEVYSEKPVGREATEQRRKALQGAMNIAVLMWNAAILGKEGEDKAVKELSSLKGPNGESVAPPMDEILRMVKEWTELQKTMFPDEKRVILDLYLKHNGDGTFNFGLNKGINTNPVGVVKPEGTVL